MTVPIAHDQPTTGRIAPLERRLAACAVVAWCCCRWPHPTTVAGTVVIGCAMAVVAWRRRTPPVQGTGHRTAPVTLRRRRAIVVAGVLAPMALTWWSARAHDALVPVEPRVVGEVVTLLTDPEPAGNGRVRAEVRLADGTRLAAESRVPAVVARLGTLRAGVRIAVRGRQRPFSSEMSWAVARHLRGRLVVDRLDAVHAPSRAGAVANALRDALDRGAWTLPSADRALLAGLVFGDERGQPADYVADFRASGLTHLLAVSGQNVAFVLVVAAPLLTRLPLLPRFLLAVAVVVAFAFVTRFEPSVVRAATMTTVALAARTAGRPTGGVGSLSVAVSGLLLVDPLVVHSLGFRLSIAASLGVLVLAPAVSGRLPGPRWWRETVGLTVGAQVAVAPVLVPVAGAMPLAAIPANILAAPAAGALMVWGLTAGLVAGVAPSLVARLVHVPTAVGLRWLTGVADLGASLPVGRATIGVIVIGVVAVVSAHRLRRRGIPWLRLAAAVVVAVGLLPVVWRSVAPVRAGPHGAGFAATVWVDDATVIVDAGRGVRAVDVFDTLRRVRTDHIDLLVVRTSRSADWDEVTTIRSVVSVATVIAPAERAGEGVAPFDEVTVLRAGRFVVHVDDPGPPSRVRVGWAADP